ncbi:MAG: GNAT family N-acetyltransferase [Gemmatimonadetes bacterium]|nr:GNAT family N-acetyltransferase [Gemmatimonadota bacterium]
MILPQHQQPITVRLAREADIEGAKQIADQYRAELGFVNSAILRVAQSKGWLLVAAEWKDLRKRDVVVGFANFRIKQDRNATLYEIAVAGAYRHTGVGTRLMSELIRRVHLAGGQYVRLKCPQELSANQFYQKCGFRHGKTEQGKKRQLQVWHYRIPPMHEPDAETLPITRLVPVLNKLASQKPFTKGTEFHAPAQFYASLTVKPDEMRTLHHLWHKYAHDFDWKFGKPNPFQRVLISPVVTRKYTFDFVRELKRTGETEVVMFDSGGYFVQKGDISYYDLHRKLYECYQQEDWADIYVLPDNPPLSKDSLRSAESKIKQTVEGSLRLYRDLSYAIQQKAMPVVHATRSEHLDYCLRQYANFKKIGFGSFPTSGTSNSINRLNIDALMILRQLTLRLDSENIKLHTFGISTPPAIYLLSLAGVHSFDSNGWMRSGGYGKIFLPFMRGYLVTFNSRRNRSLNEAEFKQWKENIKHDCPFCDSFEELSNNRWNRVMHNLIVMSELETHQRTPQTDMLRKLSGTYYRMSQSIIDGDLWPVSDHDF